jgi:hypothetical protein
MRRLLAALLGTLVSLGVIEGGVRTFAPQPIGSSGPLNRGQLTEPGDHRVRADEYDVTVHVNRDGFADREWPALTSGGAGGTPSDHPTGGVAGGVPPAPGGTVVVIGDSFVQAAQVPPGQGFGARLEAGLRADGHDVDVLSMGVPGAGTATALGVLRTVALPRHPDLVVLGFLVANDVLNNHPLLEGKDDKPFYTLRGGVLVPLDAASAVADSPLWRWSAAWRWATRAMVQKRVAERKLSLGNGLPLDLRVHDPACVGGGGTAPHCPTWDEAWAVTDALIAEMARECAGTRFAVVLFPDRVQVERSAPAWPAAAGWDFDAAEARAARVAGAHAPVLDLLPPLRATGEDLYLHRDGHWTARGHAAAAAATVPFVERLLDAR